MGPSVVRMVSGAIVGSGLTRGRKVRWAGGALGGRRPCETRLHFFEQFHNDADRRDYISMGAAVGFAAAFGAPVGGVLFALEEAMTSWNCPQMWRTLTATTIACYTIALSERYIAPAVFDPAVSCAFNSTDALSGGRKDVFDPGLLT